MRQSPTLLALLTVSATLGFASQAYGSEVTDLLPSEVAEATSPGAVPTATVPELELPDVDLVTAPLPTVADLEAASEVLETITVEVEVTDVEAAAAETTVEATPLALEIVPEVSLDASVSVDAISQADPADEGAPESADEPTEPVETNQQEEETRVLVAEVAVTNAAGELLDRSLEDAVFNAISTEAGRTTTRTQLQRDINNIFSTGIFANVRALPEDTPLGVRITFVVQPNPVLTQVEVTGNEALPDEVVNEIFSDQYGEIIDLIAFQDRIVELNEWYQDNGYVLAQVIASPEISPDGIVTLVVAEGVIEDIQVRYISEEGLAEDEDGNPIQGRTREFIITRELETQEGDIFQQDQIQSDLQRVFGLGLFDDINLSLAPGEENPRDVTMIINVVERNTGSVAAGLGFNFTGDVFGTLSYRQENFGGNNQKFSAETQLSTRDLLFDISFTDPWIAGDPNRTSYTVNAFARRSVPLVFDNGPVEINLANGDRVRLLSFGGGLSFRRPLGGGWSGSVGTRFQRIRATDADGNTNTVDAAGNPLTASSTGVDDLWTFQVGVVRDLRDNGLTPTRGSVLRLSTEQSVPLGSGSIFFNRVQASYSYYLPVSFLSFGEGAQVLAFNLQGGTIIGDFPPYEAFSLGGTNSVRGFEEGEVGSGRHYIQATAEYRFPIFSFVGGALFLDAATDLGSGDDVPGNPAGDRGKPGSGIGYGGGLRIQTPLGPIRIDYGFSDDGGGGRLHFGIGERF
ncbi:MAG: BamA/TamA family outer membrane protein [Leptolyngbyaceae cyanobacterium]